jgi:calcineurin-like phosphoesterase family protein
MNANLISNWNKKVKKEDTVYILGDVIFSNSVSETKKILTSLNGKKILVYGNHDGFIKKNKEA